MASVEKHSSGSGRPKGMTGQVVHQRRSRCYQLWLMGFNETEIAQSIGISQSNVSRHIDVARRQNPLSDKTARERHWAILQQTYDSNMLVMREAWKLFLDPENGKKPEVRANLLARIQTSVGLLTRFIPNADYLEFEKRIEDLRADMARTGEKINEMKLRDRISPFSAGT